MLRLDDAVSIHAPREGCDVAESVKGFFLRGFNSRTPGGVRLGVNKPNTNLRKFQFTHPGRGATPSQSKSLHHGGSFNSRTPGGVRPVCRSTRPSDQAVSIHAPREGCDARRHHQDRGADEVSIHAPREGCDQILVAILCRGVKFQFTHPGRGATVWCKVAYYGADKQA